MEEPEKRCRYERQELLIMENVEFEEAAIQQFIH